MSTATATPEQAADQFRAAVLVKQLKTEGSSIFVHAPRPAIVASEPQYGHQRRFGTGVLHRDTKLDATEREAHLLRAKLAVYRDGGHDVAEVTAELGLFTSAQITIRLHPAELRDLAARLIDAAHDIEVHPAAALACAEAEAA